MRWSTGSNGIIFGDKIRGRPKQKVSCTCLERPPKAMGQGVATGSNAQRNGSLPHKGISANGFSFTPTCLPPLGREPLLVEWQQDVLHLKRPHSVNEGYDLTAAKCQEPVGSK